MRSETEARTCTTGSPLCLSPENRTTTTKMEPRAPRTQPRASAVAVAKHVRPANLLTAKRAKPAVAMKSKTTSHTRKKFVGDSKSVTATCMTTPTTTLTFLSSLTIDTPENRCHPDARQYLVNFKKKKEELGRRLYHLYNREIFEGCLPNDMEITWNVRLTKTAALCYSRRYTNKMGIETRSSRIELSSKIIDSGDRLRDTLVHEMCHAASWITSGYRDGHGPLWRTWAEKAMQQFPELPIINRCHSYDIRTKYSYVCQRCGYTIGRHSKSFDTEKKVCGHCHGRFELAVNTAAARKDSGSAQQRGKRPKSGIYAATMSSTSPKTPKS